MTMERRGFMVGVAAAMGGIVYSSGLAAMLANATNAEKPLPMIARDAWINQAVDVFSPEKRALVSAMCETLIPKTDTAGAKEAGVPKFIELLYAQWMAEPERMLFDKGLAEADKRAQANHGGIFAQCDAGAQKAVLEAMEEEQGDHPWFAFGGQSVADARADTPFMALFKEIAVTGFFMSEIGAQEVLRYAPMAGIFDGEASLASDESSWAATPFM
ncbi:gluconate 2-dehydrogenase subunit 3 family protein [Parasphingorhabdus halotolerans]|uniref:Gluconate 2-dehydrogenase subunit 3 family protein n=1 Tax=Parasphingorhabdus halotolerans TaxID=2725558 RepID=A0A6H2DMD7_9SPHN|nr:gluconate 2-dehydrogenase subunit 3 family protein [Parasphingorhabdus halotolerans]QJB68826.1 gluconate 2-dehydrogenase subunit 3 family protein [Parasphingorhabdus halotolerans]